MQKLMICLLFLCAVLCGQGREHYLAHCAACHGALGNGRGEFAGEFRDNRPRDFTLANFRFRSTPSGELPFEDDLKRTVGRGVDLTHMPAFNGVLRADEITSVVKALQKFSEKWNEADALDTLLPETKPVPVTDRTVLKGKALYKLLKCADCHGLEGRGDGPKAKKLVNDAGQPILPRDYRWGRFKSGSGDEDIARAILMGLDGTPMASFAPALPGKRVWYLLAYIRQFEEKAWLVKTFSSPLP